ncbi:MAG: class I SAM-dependent methyltransferase [Betaproteobacteria bacterium]
MASLTPPDIEAFRNRLARNDRHWSRWARRQRIECFRIYDRDIPQFPLAIDRYGHHLHLQEIDTGWQQTDAEHDAWLDAVRSAVSEVTGASGEQIHLKHRERQRGAAQYRKLRESGAEFAVDEGGLRFLVDLDSYLDTGLFLDHRKTRGLVRELAGDQRFLNLFCYTGSFTIYAAAGGARESESVDLSNTYLSWAERNLRLNNHDPSRHLLVRADAFAYLDGAARAGKEFDLIVLDPPSFSNSKRMIGLLDIQRDHRRLIDGSMRLLSRDGQLIFSTNRRQFEFDAAIGESYRCDDVHAWSIPEDFRNRSIHRCWQIRHRN